MFKDGTLYDYVTNYWTDFNIARQSPWYVHFVHASGNLEYFAGAIFDNLGFVK